MTMRYYLHHPLYAAKRFVGWFVNKYERARRGWSAQDWWNFDTFGARVIADVAREHRLHGHGYPGSLDSIDQWREILSKIEDGYLAYLAIVDEWPFQDDGYGGLKAKYDEGARLFAQWLPDMWD